ncbi:acetyl-CoA carboxylase biotin carboxyl carrier protein [Hippea maritima]|uniref:Biotin carboxyl carrier protein of acetyl-CoA carboxylase n=1 Tax=Hippea maritima (strain ATCC 700847 / DSM 10411 / MH2) TaxID=760142 RepID=F2LV90_HIPMA|nr:acetyl-CoA carboxylase biotin carboxyl carrier protein [Hippea maritima]AEA33674.1 acetyl-CoA carboxylase, biotin carboxyl carrier protein [Hippea maritima DSM 10411]
MDLKSLKELMRFVEKSQFVEFEYKDEEIQIILKKKEAFVAENVLPQPQAIVVEQEKPKEEPKTEEKQVKQTQEDPSLVEIKSPMVATFYRAPSPTSPPYVEVGDEVKKGDVLCILEAMKIMNELEAEFPCRIEKILVENAQKVEYDQPLFLVKRLD